MYGDEWSVDIHVLYVVGVVGIALGETGNDLEYASQTIHHTLVVLFVRVAAVRLLDVFKVVIVHQVLNEVGDDLRVALFFFSPARALELFQVYFNRFHVFAFRKNDLHLLLAKCK